MDIVLAKRHDRQRWDHYVLSHPHGTPYQLFAWRHAVERAYGFDGIYLMARDGADICGVLPLIDFRGPFITRRLVSLPYCDAGGVLADHPETAKQLFDEACRWFQTIQAAYLEIRKTDGGAAGTQCAKVRMVLELPESAEQLLAGMKAKLRSQINKPRRDGLVALLGGAELLREFYRVWTINMHDLGSPVHSYLWFEQIVAEFGQQALVGVVRTPDGEPAAAGIILLSGQTVSIPWASSLRQFNHLNANMLLYWTFLSYAADQGYRWFDFGRSTPGEGTYRFKAQWGACPRPLTWTAISADGVRHDLQPGKGVMRSHAEALWRHLPLGCCNTLGPVIRRHVSL